MGGNGATSTTTTTTATGPSSSRPTSSSYPGPERRLWQSPPSAERRTNPHSYVKAKVTEVARIFCRLRRDQGAVIDVARGLQTQVAYGDEPGTTPAQPSYVLLDGAFGGFKGVVKSGSEWVLVRNDGVALVDARVTVAFATDVLMDMTLKGTIDLKDTFNSPDGKSAYREYQMGTKEPALKEDADRYFHNITGSIRFEGGGGPVDGGDYSDHFSRASKLFDAKLELLLRQQFNFVGKVFITRTPHYDPTDTKLVVLSWGP